MLVVCLGVSQALGSLGSAFGQSGGIHGTKGYRLIVSHDGLEGPFDVLLKE